MMKGTIITPFNQETGCGVSVHSDPDGEDILAVEYYQDCQPLLDFAHEKRSDRANWSVKVDGNDWWHEASIPIAVQMELVVKYGLETWNPEHLDAIMKKVATEYKYLCTCPKNLI